MPVPSGFAAALRSEPGAAKTLLAGFNAFVDALPEASEIRRGGDNEETWGAWDTFAEKVGEVFTDGEAPYVRIARRGAAAAVALIQRDLTDDARERAARWAATDGGRLLARESQKTLQAIRELTAAALRGEISRRTAARQIMQIRGFGLDSWRMGQLLRKVEGWEAAGISGRNVRRRARKEYKRLLLRRAKDIWGFESRSAVWEGARQGWAEAQKQGAMKKTAKIVWRHPGSSRGHPCPRCGALIGVTVGVTESFKSRPVEGGGREFNGKTLVRRRPPEHKLCDCYLETAALPLDAGYATGLFLRDKEDMLMKRRHSALELIGAATLAAALVLLGSGAFSAPPAAATATTAPGGGVIETGLANGDSEWTWLSGSQACTIWSTSWDSATVDMETLVAGTRVVPTKLLDVDVDGLKTVTTDIANWVRFDAGAGYYRLEIGSGAGSESINWHCRPIP